MPAFVDTNILMYSVSDSADPLEVAKAKIARELLERDDLFVSAQVLQEFYVQATRPSRPGALSHDLAREFIESWGRFDFVWTDKLVIDTALALRAETGFQYWDCAIIAAAQIAGCDTLFTEDMQDGRVIGSVILTNPFRAVYPA